LGRLMRIHEVVYQSTSSVVVGGGGLRLSSNRIGPSSSSRKPHYKREARMARGIQQSDC